MTGLNFDNFACGSLPETHALMRQARPCRCCSTRLLPVSGCERPPTLAIACEECGMIQGEVPTLAEAIANWNQQCTG